VSKIRQATPLYDQQRKTNNGSRFKTAKTRAQRKMVYRPFESIRKDGRRNRERQGENSNNPLFVFRTHISAASKSKQALFAHGYSGSLSLKQQHKKQSKTSNANLPVFPAPATEIRRTNSQSSNRGSRQAAQREVGRKPANKKQ
jgi:hypothetical protein